MEQFPLQLLAEETHKVVEMADTSVQVVDVVLGEIDVADAASGAIVGAADTPSGGVVDVPDAAYLAVEAANAAVVADCLSLSESESLLRSEEMVAL